MWLALGFFFSFFFFKGARQEIDSGELVNTGGCEEDGALMFCIVGAQC